MIGAAVKRLAGICAAPLLSLAFRLSGRRAGLALLYHAVDRRPGDPATELVPAVGRRQLAGHLRHLRRFYEVVPVEDFLAAVRRRRRGQRFPACVTFDDDAPQHVEHAVPVLREHGVPAMFFLCGGGLDGSVRRSTWWERLQRALDSGASTAQAVALLPPPAASGFDGQPPSIHELGAVIERLTPDERDEFSDRLVGLAGPDPPNSGLSPDGVRTLLDAGCGIGFHTRGHDTLTRLDDGLLERALRDGRPELERIAGKTIDAIAYPHGRANDTVAQAARRAGFRVGFTDANRTVTPESDPLLLGRVEPVYRPLGGPMTQSDFAIGLVRVLRGSASRRPTAP